MATLKQTSICLMILCILLGVGCAALTTNERAVSLEDIVFLTRHGLSDEVIIKHIDQTGSRFDLTTSDLAMLKDEGVDDEVISHMMDRTGSLPPFAYEYDRPVFPGTSFYYHPPVYQMYIPIYETYDGYYPSNQLYRPMVRQPGLIGRFYEYPESLSIEADPGRRESGGSDEAGADRSGRDGDSEPDE